MSGRTVQDAKKVATEAPDLVEKVLVAALATGQLTGGALISGTTPLRPEPYRYAKRARTEARARCNVRGLFIVGAIGYVVILRHAIAEMFLTIFERRR